MSLEIESEKKSRKGLIGVIALVIVAGGLYSTALVLSPYYFIEQQLAKNVSIVTGEKVTQANRLYIPRIGVSLSYKTGDKSVLNSGLWHRAPAKGDPEQGGNFVVTGYRFKLALTPQETYQASSLFGVDKLKQNDLIAVDFNGKRYEYKVNRRYKTKSGLSEIEASSRIPKLTLYTSDTEGGFDNREIIEAVPRQTPTE